MRVYSTWRKGKSYSNIPLVGDMLVPRRVPFFGNFHSSSPSEIRVAFFQPKNTHYLKSSCSTSIARAIHVWYIYLQLGWLYGFHVGTYTCMLWVITYMSFEVNNMIPKKTSCFTKFKRIINLDLFLGKYQSSRMSQ